MNFGERFKKMRSDKQLTQEQIATQLNVTRQAISNWENNRNLPDLEMIIHISKTFEISLDQLILGDEDKSNVLDKLIKDGSETRKAKFNLITVCIGTLLLLLGIGCLLIKANSVEYIDANGFLYENFFLLPIGFSFIFCGLITFVIMGIKSMISALKSFYLKKMK